MINFYFHAPLTDPVPKMRFEDLPEHERQAIRAILHIRKVFEPQLRDLPEALETQVAHTAATMCVFAGENKTKLLEWATSRLLPTHLRYSLTEDIVEVTRRESRGALFPLPVAEVLGKIGEPPSPETVDLILDDQVSAKKAAIHLIRDLWGKEVDGSNLDTAHTKQRTWKSNELLELTQCMIRGQEITRKEMPTNREFSWTAKRWGVLMGAYLFRTARGDFNPQPGAKETKRDFHQNLAEKLYPPAQKLLWLRDIWLKEGETGFPDMVEVEPALAQVSPDVVRQLANKGADGLTEKEQEIASDGALRELLALAGIKVTPQALRHARRTQVPFFEKKTDRAPE